MMKKSFVYLFLTAAAAALLYPILSGKGSFCTNPDNLHQAYPFFYKLATSLHRGYLPVWDANTYGGKNLPGEFQAGVFYPLNIGWCWLFGSVRGIDVYYLDLLVALHYLICLVGMYRVGRVFRLPEAAAAATTLVFTFSGVLSARAAGQTCIFFGLAWMPWAIYFVGRYYQDRAHKKYLIFCGLIGGLEILAGHVQPFFHTLLICGGLILFYEYQDRKDWKSFALSVATNGAIVSLVGLLAAFPQVYDSLGYMGDCYRWVGADQPIGPGEKLPFHIYAYKNIIRLSDLPNLLGRYFGEPEDGNLLYMGIPSLFLAVAWLARRKGLAVRPEHTRLGRILVLLLVFGFLSVLGYVTYWCIGLYELPFVPSIRELGRYGVLINFSGALLVGLALTYIAELGEVLFRNHGTIKRYALLALVLNAGYLVLAERNHSFPLAVTLPFLLGFLFLLLLGVSARKPVSPEGGTPPGGGQRTALLRACFIVFLFADLFVNKVNYGSTDSFFYPTRYYARNRIIDSLETTYGKYRVDFEVRNDSLLRRNIGDVYSIQTKLGYCATMNRPYFNFISRDWDMNGRGNDLLNIKYIVTDQVLDSNYIFRDSTGGLNLYERRRYFPRIYWSRQLGLSGPEIEKENAGTIQTQVYADQYQRISVDCPTPDTLIFSENIYPGWKCYDNGQRVKLFPAVIPPFPPLFRAVVLERGHHLLEFRYSLLPW